MENITCPRGFCVWGGVGGGGGGSSSTKDQKKLTSSSSSREKKGEKSEKKGGLAKKGETEKSTVLHFYDIENLPLRKKGNDTAGPTGRIRKKKGPTAALSRKTQLRYGRGKSNKAIYLLRK